MNAYGVRVDKELINGALAIDDVSTQKLSGEAIELTGLDNPNSTSQVLDWLRIQGVELPNLQKPRWKKHCRQNYRIQHGAFWRSGSRWGRPPLKSM